MFTLDHTTRSHGSSDVNIERANLHRNETMMLQSDESKQLDGFQRFFASPLATLVPVISSRLLFDAQSGGKT